MILTVLFLRHTKPLGQLYTNPIQTQILIPAILFLTIFFNQKKVPWERERTFFYDTVLNVFFTIKNWDNFIRSQPKPKPSFP